jgi:hypothetical protein
VVLPELPGGPWISTLQLLLAGPFTLPQRSENTPGIVCIHATITVILGSVVVVVVLPWRVVVVVDTASLFPDGRQRTTAFFVFTASCPNWFCAVTLCRTGRGLSLRPAWALPVSLDADGDGWADTVETRLGSDPNAAARTPESVALAGSCFDGADKRTGGRRAGRTLGWPPRQMTTTGPLGSGARWFAKRGRGGGSGGRAPRLALPGRLEMITPFARELFVARNAGGALGMRRRTCDVRAWRSTSSR